MPITPVRKRIGSSPSARWLRGAGLFPVDEQKPAGCVQLRLARSRQDLELQLFDLVLGTIPAGEREVPVAPGAGQQHSPPSPASGGCTATTPTSSAASRSASPGCRSTS